MRSPSCPTYLGLKQLSADLAARQYLEGWTAMSLESETNTVESLKEAARHFGALADAVGEQIRPAIKMAVDAADDYALSVGATRTSTSPIAEARMAREHLDAAAQDLGVLIDSVGDQVRPAIKLAVDTADALAEAVESARAATDRLWKSLGLRIQSPIAAA